MVAAPSRILVISLRRIGDLLLTTPLIRSLRRAWPDADIDVLVFANTAGILAGNPDINRVIAMPQRPTAAESARLFAKLWRRYDISISTQSGDRPTVFSFAAAPFRAGVVTDDDPWFGRVVKRATYERDYHALTKTDGAPFVPYAVWKDLFFAAFIILAVAACAFYFGPFGPTGQPDPTIIQTAPKPDYFFLWLYALLSLLPPSMETPFLLIVPPIAILALILLPFLSGEGEKSWKRRPIAVISVLLIAITLGTFTRMAQFAPWSPQMNAWSGDPVPDRFVHGTTALERQGALVFQVKQCRNCHSLGDTGGKRGPALDSVAVRLTNDQLIRQVIQGGGNMPAYGNNLSPAETTALVAFLESLHPAGQAPARDGSRDIALGESGQKELRAQQ